VAAQWRTAVFPLGSKAGASTEEWGSIPSPWWPRAAVQASVKKGGACSSAWKETATRCRGSRGRRHAVMTWFDSLPASSSGFAVTTAPRADSPPPAPPLPPS
jgi:hypothetical protein